MTFSLFWISDGVPSAIFSPKFNTTIRSEIFMTAGMSCSTNMIVTPRSSRTERTRLTIFMVSSWFIPAKGSSSSSTLGAVARPMAIPNARRLPCGRLLACSLEISDMPKNSNNSSAYLPKLDTSSWAVLEPQKYPARDAFARRCCATTTLSCTVIFLKIVVS